MKILVAHEKFPPEVAGGGETIVYNLVKGLITRGHHVTVITTGNPKIKQFDGIKTIRIPINRYLMNLSYPIILKHAKDYDLIQTTSGNMCFPSWKAAKTLNKPIVCLILHLLSHHWKTIRGDFVGTIFRQMEKLFLGRNYDSIVVMNDNAKNLLRKINKASKVYEIPSGFDFKSPKPVKKTKSILFVGNLSMNKTMIKLKGLTEFVVTAKYFPDYEFYVVGKGDYLSEIKRHSPSNVIFTGPLFGDKLRNLFSKSEIFCNLSLSEGFGLTTAEAMASGCAVISTIDIGQLGMFVNPKDVHGLRSALHYLLTHPTEMKQMVSRNKKIAQKYTWDRFVEGFVKIYKHLV